MFEAIRIMKIVTFCSLLFSCALSFGLSRHCLDALASIAANPYRGELERYEAIRVLGLEVTDPKNYIENFRAQTGITVTKRDSNGNALEGKIRVLSDNNYNRISVVGPFNNWGVTMTDEDELHSVPGTRYY